MATCDLAVATDDARFGTSGVRTGLFCTTPGVAVARTVGRKHALELLLTGELVDARTALAWGLVNRVVPVAELDAAVQTFVDTIASLSPVAIARGKAAFYAQVEVDEGRAYELAKAVMAENALDADAQEGMSAFVEKADPRAGGLAFARPLTRRRGHGRPAGPNAHVRMTQGSGAPAPAAR